MIRELFDRYVIDQGVDGAAQGLNLTPGSIEKVLAGTAQLRQIDVERLFEVTGSRLVNGSSAAAGPLEDARTEINLAESSFSLSYRKPGYPLTILIPFVSNFTGAVLSSLLYYAKHLDVGFELQGNSLLLRARHDLAKRFLATDAQWSLWLDSDVFMPFGNPAIYFSVTQSRKMPQKFAEYNTIERLLTHKKPLVGGVYAARYKGGSLVIQPELEPRNPNDRQIATAIREGRSAGGLVPVNWLAAGLMLVHRKVFEIIMAKEPIQAEYYPFFLPENATDGEDVAFCKRAIRCGIQPMLDTEIRAAHIGPGVWMPEDSLAPVKMAGRQ
jgi:hypothetical protein